MWQLLGTAPRTVSFETDQWSNDSWGLHNFVRDKITGTVMVYADGSRVNKFKSRHYEHFFIPSGDWTVHSIYLRPANVAYEVDDNTKTARLWRCTCTWDEQQEPPVDAACLSAARAHIGADATELGVGEVAGASVIRYRKTRSSEDYEVAFAPKFGCDLLEERRATYNAIGLPTFRFHFVVRSYLPGNPAQSDLEPPTGYVVTEKPRRPPLSR